MIDRRDNSPGLQALRHLRQTARLLILRSGIEDYPIGIWGTCFVVGYRRRIFAVAAAHQTKSNHSGDLMVAAANDFRYTFQLGAGVMVSPPDDPDAVDVIVYPTGLSGLDRPTLADSRIIRLDEPETAWHRTAYVSDFWVVGYPRDLNGIDYERQVVQAAQAVLPGRYGGVMRVDGHLHRLKVEDPHALTEFAGFSGGPVFSLTHQIAADPQLRFCGVAVMGSVQHGLVQFVGADAVKFVLDTAIQHLEGSIKLPGPPPEDL